MIRVKLFYAAQIIELVVVFFHMSIVLGFCLFCFVFSSPEPKAPEGAYSIGRLHHLSVVCLSTISKDFSETNGLIVTKFHIWPPGVRGTKSC